MKHFIFAIAIVTNLIVALEHVHAGEGLGHGGGNGGSDQELQLTKRAQQIGHFLKSKMGSSVFKMLNPDTVLDTINAADFDVIDGVIQDKYGVERTCVNEPSRGLVTCSLQRILDLQKNDDILTGIIFHEILGLMEIELGHQDNVSMYPISSKILPYHNVVASTPISEAQIRPEFYGLDSRSYGVTLINKVTKETLRLICLNDNVEVHRCRNYSLVRSAQKLQAPVVPNVVSISPSQLKAINLKHVTVEDINQAARELEKLRAEKLTFGTLNDRFDYTRDVSGFSLKGEYRYGSGLTQLSSYGAIIALPVVGTIDTVIEGGKQVGNLLIYPVKGIIKAIKKAKLKGRIAKYNKKIDLASRVLNQEGNLSLIGTSKQVSDEDFQIILNILSLNILSSSL